MPSAYEPSDQRYYFASYSSGLGSVVFDPDTGVFSDERLSENPVNRYDNVAVGNGLVAIADGRILAASDLSLVGRVPPHQDAYWMPNGSLMTLSRASDGWFVREYDGDLQPNGVYTFPGGPDQFLDRWILRNDDQFTLMTLIDGRPEFSTFAPMLDTDRDGVANVGDAFPLDPAASLDRDRDGAPDEWNDSFDPASGTTELALDEFPDDAACQLPEHALATDPATCDIAARMSSFIAAETVHEYPSTTQGRVIQHTVAVDSAGVVHFLDPQDLRIHRRRLSDGGFLNPIYLSETPTSIVFLDSDQKIYVGYDTGAVRRFDPSQSIPVLEPFAALPQQVSGLVDLGDRLLAWDLDQNWVFAADGSVLQQIPWRGFDAEGSVWNAATGEMLTIDFYLEAVAFDLSSGEVTGDRGVPRDERSAIHHGNQPVRPSPNGELVLLGNGQLFSVESLRRLRKLGTQIVDAAWISDELVVTIRKDEDGNSLVEYFDDLLRSQRSVTLPGDPRHLFFIDNRVVAVTAVDDRLGFHANDLDADDDGDGTANGQDAFPDDPAASIDADHDGFPDVWNDGFTSSEATPELRLDAYPEDSACYATAHAVSFGGDSFCIAPFAPDQIVADDFGTLYMLDAQASRVYRWAADDYRPLRPIVIHDIATAIAYSPTWHRLLIGYHDGALRQIDLAAEELTETMLVDVSTGPRVDWVFAYGDSVAVQTDRIRTFEPDGSLFSESDASIDNEVLAPNPGTNRLYHLTDDSDWLLWRDINNTHGVVLASSGGDLPDSYSQHLDREFPGPMRVSAGGQRLINRLGDVYDAEVLEYQYSLPLDRLTDAVWVSETEVITIRPDQQGNTLVEHWTGNERLDQQTFVGAPVAIRLSGEHIAVVSDDGSLPAVNLYQPPTAEHRAQLIVSARTTPNHQLRLTISGDSSDIRAFRIDVTTTDPSLNDPIELQLVNEWGNQVVFNEYVSSDPQTGTFLVAPLSPGTYLLQIHGPAEVDGTYRTVVDASGYAEFSDVEQQRRLMQAELMLIDQSFVLPNNIRRVLSEHLQIDLDHTHMAAELDTNGNGLVDSDDIRVLSANLAPQQAPITATLTPLGGPHFDVSTPIIDQSLLRLGDLHFSVLTNPVESRDANGDGQITALDALQVLNLLGRGSLRGNELEIEIPRDSAPVASPPALFYDVTADNQLSALDALRIINALRRQYDSEAEFVPQGIKLPATPLGGTDRKPVDEIESLVESDATPQSGLASRADMPTAAKRSPATGDSQAPSLDEAAVDQIHALDEAINLLSQTR